MANAICSVSDCDGTASHRGMCRKHYSAWLYRQPPTSDADRCSTDGCARRRQARGMCIPHWSTWQRRQPGYARKRQINRRERKVDIQCQWCGATASVNAQAAKVQRYCGLKCHARANNSPLTRAEWQELDDRRKPVRYTGPRRLRPAVTVVAGSAASWKSGQCQVCSARFLSKQFDATCSDECNKARARDMNREYTSTSAARVSAMRSWPMSTASAYTNSTAISAIYAAGVAIQLRQCHTLERQPSTTSSHWPPVARMNRRTAEPRASYATQSRVTGAAASNSRYSADRGSG